MATSETFVSSLERLSTEPAEYVRKPTFQASGYDMLRAIRMEKGWSKIQIHWLSGSLHAPPHAANTVSPIRGMTFSHLSFNFLGGSPKAQLQQRVQIGESTDQQFLPQKAQCYHLNGNPSNFLWLHPGRLTWNLQITRFESKMIFQTSMIMFHVNLGGCKCMLSIFSIQVHMRLRDRLSIDTQHQVTF